MRSVICTAIHLYVDFAVKLNVAVKVKVNVAVKVNVRIDWKGRCTFMCTSGQRMSWQWAC